MSTLLEMNGTVRTFNSQGFLTAITDRNENIVTIVRSGAQIQRIIEPLGRTVTTTLISVWKGGYCGRIPNRSHCGKKVLSIHDQKMTDTLPNT